MRYRPAAVGVGIALAVLAAGCASSGQARSPSPTPAPAAANAAQDTGSADRPQYPSTYQRHANAPVLIRNATIMTATGQEIAGGSILFRDGRIVSEHALLRNRFGRLRTVVEGPDGALYALTSNRDGRGTPRKGDDQILRITPPR